MYRKILSVIAIFLIGWVAHASYSVFSVQPEKNVPENTAAQQVLENSESEEQQFWDKVFAPEADEDRDKVSPYDWIKMDQISVYQNQVVIKLENPEWALFTDTKSMDPVIDGASNAIEIIPNSEKDIHIGDIVAYKSDYATGVITHRVVDIGQDDQGWFARMKGDNNDKVDPGKIRFEQIQRVVVAVIY